MKIKPCKKCGSTDIQIWDCGYSSFNPGGGTCNKCGFKVEQMVGCMPSREELVDMWNRGQKLDDTEKLKLERAKTKLLRRQLRDNGLEPAV